MWGADTADIGVIRCDTHCALTYRHANTNADIDSLNTYRHANTNADIFKAVTYIHVGPSANLNGAPSDSDNSSYSNHSGSYTNRPGSHRNAGTRANPASCSAYRRHFGGKPE